MIRSWLRSYQTYADYLASEDWENIRSYMMMLANFHCELCEGRAEHVHHLTYARVGRENFDDLMVLCQRCHHLQHLDKLSPLDQLIATALRRVVPSSARAESILDERRKLRGHEYVTTEPAESETD